MKRRIYALVAVSGFIILLATAGASDLGTITIPGILIFGISGLLIMFLGLYKGGYLE